MANDEAAIEAEIQAKGKTAPRLTPQLIDEQIVGKHWFRASDAAARAGQPTQAALECLTICVLVLKNGFTLTGTSACASPENYDKDIGEKIAYENARAQIWAHEGYVLKNKLAGI